MRVDRKCDGHNAHAHRQVNLYSVRALHSIGQTLKNGYYFDLVIQTITT